MDIERIWWKGADDALHEELSLRIFIAAAALLMLSFPQVGNSQEGTEAELDSSRPVKLSPADQAIRSDALAKEARDKAETLERARDRKMKQISKGICTGC
jgi:hypothetical protein